MLVYSRLTNDQDASASGLEERGGHPTATDPPEPLPRAKAAVLALNESHASACKTFEDRYGVFVRPLCSDLSCS